MLNGFQLQKAKENYRRHVIKASYTDLWSRLTGAETDLIRFADVAQPLQLRQQIQRGVHMVPLRQIVGSVGRAQDFTRTFLPRPRVDQERWAQVDLAFQQLANLPPVELFQVGQVYFVRDGHHRISVAQANGMREIEANVVELVSPVALQVEDFQQDRWLKLVNLHQEKLMLTVNYEMAKLDHVERLRQTEQTQLLQGVGPNRPASYTRLLGKLSNLFSVFGTNLKSQQSHELVEV